MALGRVSSDVAGACCRAVEESFGAPAVFCCSAAGDQMPREQAFLEAVTADGMVVPRDDGVAKGLEIVERLGAEMGCDATVAGALEALKDRFPAEYAKYHDAFTAAAQDEALAERVGLINPLSFIGTVDNAMVWDLPHCEADYPGEVCDWIDRISEQQEKFM